MNFILELRKAIVAEFRERFERVPVDEHTRSTFTAADLRHSLAGKPRIAIRVGFEGVLEDAKDELAKVNLQITWAAYVCARDGGKEDIPRDQAILRLIPDLIALVSAQPWEAPDGILLGKPKTFRVVGGFQGDVDDTASEAVWLVRWKQDVGFDSSTDGSTDDDLRPFLYLLTQFDLAPADETIDAEDTILLPQTEDDP